MEQEIAKNFDRKQLYIESVFEMLNTVCGNLYYQDFNI